MRNTVYRKFLYWLQICADDLLLLQMYPGWSARDNYAQTKETANNNSASFTLFLTFIFVRPFPKGFVSKEVYICVCRKRSENGRRHRTREVRLLIVVPLSKGRCRKLSSCRQFQNHLHLTASCDLEDFSYYALQVFHYKGRHQQKKTFSFGHCPNHLNPPPLTPIWTTWSFFLDVKIQDLKVTWGLKVHKKAFLITT